MSNISYYYFFDREGIDSIWHLTWHQFFRRFPKMEENVLWTLRNNCFGKNGEITEEELQPLLHKTLAWTLRRNSSQMIMMSDIMPPEIGPKRTVIGIDNFPLDDFVGPVGQATARFLAGNLDRSSYLAVLKLHNVERPSDWLRISRTEARHVDNLMTKKQLTVPIYRWQGPKACQDTPLGLWTADVSNCLNVANTMRFCAFMQTSWAKNDCVQNIASLRYTSVSRLTEIPRFRDFKLNQELMKATRIVRRMKRPVVMRFLT